jgi:hypothetical protein
MFNKCILKQKLGFEIIPIYRRNELRRIRAEEMRRHGGSRLIILDYTDNDSSLDSLFSSGSVPSFFSTEYVNLKLNKDFNFW